MSHIGQESCQPPAHRGGCAETLEGSSKGIIYREVEGCVGTKGE